MLINQEIDRWKGERQRDTPGEGGTKDKKGQSGYMTVTDSLHNLPQAYHLRSGLFPHRGSNTLPGSEGRISFKYFTKTLEGCPFSFESGYIVQR